MLSYYGRATNLIICPAAPDLGINPPGTVNPPGTAASAWHWALSTPVYSSSYGYNKWLESNLYYGYDARNYNNEAGVIKPTAGPVFTDSAWINFYPETNDPSPTSLYDPIDSVGDNGGLPRICVARHGSQSASSAPRKLAFGQSTLPGSINGGFWDGHVEQMRLENLWTYLWHPNWTPAPAPRVL